MKLTDIKNSLNEISAIGGLKQVVKGNTDRVEGIKLSKEMAQAMIDWFNSSPYGRKYPKAAKARLHISLGIMSVMGLDRYAKHKGSKEELKYIKDLSKAMRDNVNESTIRLDEGTRSQVGLIDKSGKIVSAYVHYDGYPSNMKPGIKKHMKNEKDVLKLIKMGGARGIFDDKDIEYYKSQSKPTKGDVKDIKKYLKTSDSRGGAEYVYLYDMRDKKWYMADVRASELKGLYESVVNEAKYDIGMARKGNGLTVYNKAEEENGDYKNVAHIDSKGKVKYYDKKVPSKIKKQIEMEAKKMMEITKEETMKLTDLLNEDVYVKNKKTGNTYQVKNANPSKHEPPSKGDIAKAKSDAEDEPNREPSKEEPKKDEPKNDGPKIELSKDFDEIYSARDLENDVEGLKGKIPDEDYEKIEDARMDFEQLEQMADEAKDAGYEDAEEAEEDGLDWRTQSELDKISDDLKDMIRQANGTPKEEPKQG